MSDVKAYDPYISTSVVGTVAAMAERKVGGFIKKIDYDKLTEQNRMLREALIEIAKMPEVRMDEGQYIACAALEKTK